MKRKRIVAGNWKMNKVLHDVEAFTDSLAIDSGGAVKHIIAAPSPFLRPLHTLLKARSLDIGVAGQNCHHEMSGAFTGEVSGAMLKSVGAEYVILGHSERRKYYNEDEEMIKNKVRAALSVGLNVIFCCGESLDERKANRAQEIVLKQISHSLDSLSIDDWKNVMIAYEPIWAIGTGESATAEQAQEMHAIIRGSLPVSVSGDVSILYGGSVKPDNFEELLAQPDIDGGLIGGASLSAESYNSLSHIAAQISS